MMFSFWSRAVTAAENGAPARVVVGFWERVKWWAGPGMNFRVGVEVRIFRSSTSRPTTWVGPARVDAIVNWATPFWSVIGVRDSTVSEAHRVVWIRVGSEVTGRSFLSRRVSVTKHFEVPLATVSGEENSIFECAGSVVRTSMFRVVLTVVFELFALMR